MHTVPAPASSDNSPTVAELLETRGSHGHPADADHAFIAEHFNDEMTERELDEMFAREMERREAERAPVIFRSISTATRGRFMAAVEVDGRKHALGTFRTERLADQAITEYLRTRFPRVA